MNSIECPKRQGCGGSIAGSPLVSTNATWRVVGRTVSQRTAIQKSAYLFATYFAFSRFRKRGFERNEEGRHDASGIHFDASVPSYEPSIISLCFSVAISARARNFGTTRASFLENAIKNNKPD
jgi:hypothetical protein